MSEAAALLARCQEHGITLRPGECGKLKVSPPPERLPEELREELKRHKQEILTLLTTKALAPRQEPPPDYRALEEKMLRAILDDSPLFDTWLAHHHPAVWHEILELVDELKCMEQEGVPESSYRAKLAELLAVRQQGKDLKEGTWKELPVRSTILDEEVWVVRDEEQARAVLGDGKAVYYADEFEVLKTKTPAQLRDVHKAKLAFPGCRVVQ